VQWFRIYEHARLIALLNRISIPEAVKRIEKALIEFKEQNENTIL